MTREEELRIVLMVQNGDSSAFEKLVIENQTRVYNLALRMVGNEEDAADMAQEAFIKAFNSIGNFRGDSRFSVWLYRLTTNVCLDFLRAKTRKAHGSLTFSDSEEEGKELDIPDERFSPETLAEKNELALAVHRGLKQLPADYKTILFLREVEGLSYEEISNALALEEGTVKSRIFRARKKLCEILISDRNFSYAPASNRRTATDD